MNRLFWFSIIIIAAIGGCGSRSAPQKKVIIPDPPSWASRFEATKAIKNAEQRDEEFNRLALTAASHGNLADVKKAIAEIELAAKKEQVAHGCAVTLAKHKHKEAAKEVANLIADEKQREETLKTIAAFN